MRRTRADLSDICLWQLFANILRFDAALSPGAAAAWLLERRCSLDQFSDRHFAFVAKNGIAVFQYLRSVYQEFTKKCVKKCLNTL
jgi:hypothetical protein